MRTPRAETPFSEYDGTQRQRFMEAIFSRSWTAACECGVGKAICAPGGGIVQGWVVRRQPGFQEVEVANVQF